MREKKNNMKIVIKDKYICVLLLLSIVSCFPKHKEISFDNENLKISYCNNDEKIDRVNISIRSLNNNKFKWIQTIKIIDKRKGESYIYLTKPNESYEGYLKQVEKNSEYMINLPFSDLSSFIIFQTDENSKIIKVRNDFRCK